MAPRDGALDHHLLAIRVHERDAERALRREDRAHDREPLHEEVDEAVVHTIERLPLVFDGAHAVTEGRGRGRRAQRHRCVLRSRTSCGDAPFLRALAATEDEVRRCTLPCGLAARCGIMGAP